MNEVCAAALLAASGEATPSTAPLPNISGVLRDLFLERIGREGAERRAAAGQHAEHGAQRRAAQHRGNRPPDLLAGRPQRADLDGAAAARQMSFEVDHDLGDAEQAHGDGREVDAVAEFGDVEGEALGAGVDVGADQAEQQAEEHHGDRLDDRAAGQHDGGDEAQRHQRAVVGRARISGPCASTARRTAR